METNELVPEVVWWHSLPEVCLQNVFLWLQDQDRSSAALVCKTWNHVMHSDFLWGSKRLVFDGRPSKHCAAQFESAVGYMMQFGRYLRNLEIRFVKPYNAVMTLKFQIAMRSLLARLVKTNNCLHSLAIKDLGLDRHVWRVAIRNSFIKSLSCFLKNPKRNLIYINLKGARMSMEQGCSLLSALSCPANMSRVSELDIEDYFSYHLPVFTCPIFTQAIANLRRLAILSLNYNCISDDLLEVLAKNYASTIHTLNIKCHTNDPHRQVVCGTSWYKLSRRSTDLQVNMHFERVIKHEHLVRILLAEIPMRHISLRGCYFRVPDWSLRPTLVILIPQYSRTLQMLTLQVNNFPECLDDELLQLVLHCEHLHFLKVWAFLQLCFVENLLQCQQEGKCSLHTLKVRIYLKKYGTKEEDDILHEIKMKYREVIDNGMNYSVSTYTML